MTNAHYIEAMQPLILSIVALLATSTLTPGPNNIVVMELAAHRGITGALRGIAGVVAGGIVALLLVHIGLGTIFATRPQFAYWATLVGATYLGWLGARMMLLSSAGLATNRTMLNSSFGGLATFQFCNPKCWVLALTVSSAAVQDALPLPSLITAFIVVSAASLSIWAVFGRAISSLLTSPSLAHRFNQLMGFALITSAGVMLLG